MVGSPALLPQQGTSAASSSSNSTPTIHAPTSLLKPKKSLDWLPKSFKRTKSTSSNSAAAPSVSSRGSFRGGPRPDLATGNNAQTRSTESSNSDNALPTIPASPRDTHSYSSRSSNDERSAGEHSNSPSQHSPGFPVTPEDLPFQTLRVSPLPSPLGVSGVTEPQKDYLSTPPTHQTTLRPPTSESVKVSSRSPPIEGRSLDNKESTEYEKLVLSLSSRKALRTMLDDPVGLWKFGQFLASEMNAETLVFWLNAEQHRNDLKRLYSLTQRIHSLHIPPSAPLALNITSQERTAIETSIKWFMRAEDPFKAARTAAFNALYHDAWPRFLQWRLELLHAHLKSGGKTPPATSFTLADTSPERDQPLLLASDGFLDLTGYSRDDVLMKNCRFLQGAGTSQATISRIRQACKYGQPLTELILNYRKDGVPFWSLFRLIPLRNTNGRLKYLLGAQENVTNVLSATPDLAHLLDDMLDPCVMAPRPPFEHDLPGAQMHDTGEAMRNYLKSLDRASGDKPASSSPRPGTPNKTMLSVQGRSLQPGNSPVLGANNTLGNTSSGLSTPPSSRPRSANRDMHLHAAAALAFDGTMGTVNPARGSGQGAWSQAPVHPRPSTSNSIFARPDTAYSMVDTKGKEDAQLSLAEKTKAFNEASSHYLVLDSTCDLVLFHSANLPATIRTGSSFPELTGPQLAQQIKAKVAEGARIDVRSAALAVPHVYDPEGFWRGGVKLAVTPLKDQINEVGAVIVLISNNSLRK